MKAVGGGTRRAGEEGASSALVRLRELIVERWVKPPLEQWFLRQSLVPTTPFLDPALFPWVKELEAGWSAIRTELDAVLDRSAEFPTFQDITPDVGTISDDDLWKTFFFMGFGHRGESNLSRCPRTAELLDRIPGVTTAFFSILAPGKHIAEHRGPYRGILRYHLGVKIPDPTEACGIKVGGEVRHWSDGQSLVFDDCYFHSAWNDSGDVRVVLFVDVLRPMRPIAAWLNRLVVKVIQFSPFIRQAKRNYDEWERAFDAASTSRSTAERACAGVANRVLNGKGDPRSRLAPTGRTEDPPR